MALNLMNKTFINIMIEFILVIARIDWTEGILELTVEEQNWLGPVMDQIITLEWQPREIFVFAYDFKEFNRSETDYISQELSSRAPTRFLEIGTRKNEERVENFLKSKYYRRLSTEVLYVYVFRKEGLIIDADKKINNELVNSTNMLSTAPRPKTIGIILDPNSISQEMLSNMKQQLSYFWNSFSFLHFAFVYFNDSRLPPTNFMYYQPFVGEFVIGKIEHNDQLFPDHFRHVNGYPLKFIVPVEVLDMFDNPWPSDFFPSTINFLKVFVKKLNSTLHRLNVSEYSREIDSYEYREWDMLLHKFHLYTFSHYFYLPSSVIQIRKYLIIGPRYEAPGTILLPGTIILATGAILFIIGMFFVLARWLEFSGRTWSVLNVYRCLLRGVLELGNNRAERVLGLTLILISTICMSDLFSMMLELQYAKASRGINDLDELIDSKLPIHCFVDSILISALYENAKESTSLIMSNNAAKCLLDLMEHKDRVCVFPDDIIVSEMPLAYLWMTDIMGMNDVILPMISKPIIESVLVVPFNYRSPYVEKFNQLAAHVEENVLNPFTRIDVLSVIRLNHEMDKKLILKSGSDRDLLIKTTFVLGIGYTLAILAFLGEFLVSKFHNRQRNLRNRPNKFCAIREVGEISYHPRLRKIAARRNRRIHPIVV